MDQVQLEPIVEKVGNLVMVLKSSYINRPSQLIKMLISLFIMERLLLLYILPFLFSTCNSGKPGEEIENVPIKKLMYSSRITSLNDTTFMSRIMNINEISDGLVMTDVKMNTVFFTDYDLNVIKILNNKGKGPGDFNGITKCSVWGNYFVVADAGNRRFHIFRNSNYVHDIHIRAYGPVLDDFCLDKDRNIYFSSPYPQFSPIIKLDSTGKEVGQFGIKNSSYGIFDQDHADPRNLFISDQETLLSVSVIYPVIEEYTLEGELIRQTDLSKYDFFKTYFEMLENRVSKNPELKNKNRILDLFKDVCYRNGKFYLLTWEYVTDKPYRECRKVVVVDTDKSGDFQIEEILELTGSHEPSARISYSSICTIEGNKILAFELANAEMHVFPVDPTK